LGNLAGGKEKLALRMAHLVLGVRRAAMGVLAAVGQDREVVLIKVVRGVVRVEFALCPGEKRV
jgi:hypothetical protein